MGEGSVYPGIISRRDFNKARFALNNTDPMQTFVESVVRTFKNMAQNGFCFKDIYLLAGIN